jgi:hypothetical protein
VGGRCPAPRRTGSVASGVGSVGDAPAWCGLGGSKAQTDDRIFRSGRRDAFSRFATARSDGAPGERAQWGAPGAEGSIRVTSVERRRTVCPAGGAEAGGQAIAPGGDPGRIPHKEPASQ